MHLPRSHFDVEQDGERLQPERLHPEEVARHDLLLVPFA
jgi:hypothetical protein